MVVAKEALFVVGASSGRKAPGGAPTQPACGPNKIKQQQQPSIFNAVLIRRKNKTASYIVGRNYVTTRDDLGGVFSPRASFRSVSFVFLSKRLENTTRQCIPRLERLNEAQSKSRICSCSRLCRKAG